MLPKLTLVIRIYTTRAVILERVDLLHLAKVPADSLIS